MPAGANKLKKIVPEGFKSRFDLLERWSSTRAFDWCALRHQSFDLRRVTAILLQRKNFGPNVVYSVVIIRKKSTWSPVSGGINYKSYKIQGPAPV